MRFSMQRQLAEGRLVHRGLDLVVGPVELGEARLDDAGHRGRVAGAHLDGALNVAGHDLALEQREELLLVDARLLQVDDALDRDSPARRS